MAVRAKPTFWLNAGSGQLPLAGASSKSQWMDRPYGERQSLQFASNMQPRIASHGDFSNFSVFHSPLGDRAQPRLECRCRHKWYAHQFPYAVCRHWLADQKPLDFVASVLAQKLLLLMGLNTFSDH